MIWFDGIHVNSGDARMRDKRHSASAVAANLPYAQGREETRGLLLHSRHPGSPMTSAHVGRQVRNRAARHTWRLSCGVRPCHGVEAEAVGRAAPA